MVNKPNTGNFDVALRNLLNDLHNEIPHKDILHRWDTNRGDDWYSRRKGGDAAPPPAPAKPQSVSGMTLRQYFAGQALVAMGQWSPLDSMVRSELVDALADAGISDKVHRNRAAWAVAEADALIAALDE